MSGQWISSLILTVAMWNQVAASNYKPSMNNQGENYGIILLIKHDMKPNSQKKPVGLHGLLDLVILFKKTTVNQ